jgi:hypothetical protein
MLLDLFTADESILETNDTKLKLRSFYTNANP